MNRRIWAGAAAISALAMTAAPAAAEQVTADHQKLVSLLQAKGYKAELIKGSDADYVRTADSGVPVTIFFLNCAKGKTGCTTIQFYTGFNDVKTTLERINDWNRNQRWGRAYVDKDGDPVMEMDVDMDFGGLSRELFYDNLGTFIALIPLFRDHLKK
ncbi:YbjN domain-containing protein [Sphingomonas colocasiae]|uniref:YbjN domain-containing protein n=1 Tax=Sphingomonas colocasiae TaxID=1848973 RepID=A0ABS7PNQ2_9SPHN|nr:YbjN domain-containing protein [Sphingomonas colocasiae]MBY8822939.1 YbjN domain-containing protein [Sphingomonas colocasiae]